MAPVTENHKARLHGGLVHSVITQTSATAASTLPLNSLSDLHLNKKKSKGTQQSVAEKNNPQPAHPTSHQGPEQPALDDWRDVATCMLRCEVRSRNHFGHHALIQTTANNDGLPTFLTPHPCLNQQAPREKLPSLSRPTCTAHIVEEFFSARVPRSSAEVRGLFIQDIKEEEGARQQGRQEDKRDDEEGDEVDGEVEEIRDNAHRAHET